jgi:hypothetical protein
LLTDYYSGIVIKIRNEPADSFDPVTETTLAGYSGFIQPISGNEIFRDGKGGEQATHRLYTNVSTPGVYGYKVEQNSQTYIMLYALQPGGISNVGHHKEVILGLFQ